MYDVKPGQLVECEWIDPATADYWKNAEEVTKSFDEARCYSVGRVHLVDDVGLVLFSSCLCGDNEHSLLLRQHLPWGCITKLWILDV